MKTANIEEFINLDYDSISKIAPKTVVTALGGGRRSATLEKLDPKSKQAMQLQQHQLHSSFDTLFMNGVQNIITSVSIDRHLLEDNMSRGKVLGYIGWGMASDEIIELYRQKSWRVRIIGIEKLPELQPFADKLIINTPDNPIGTIWFWVCYDIEQSINDIFDVMLRTGIQNQSDLIQQLYGELIPPAQILIGFGEPQFHYGIVPPLLMERIEAYWLQRPGYAISQETLRRILYDFAFTRQTGSGTERNDRYEEIQQQRSYWLTQSILGTGNQVGGFWYPAEFLGPDDSSTS
jgi:hypothetical protein